MYASRASLKSCRYAGYRKQAAFESLGRVPHDLLQCRIGSEVVDVSDCERENERYYDLPVRACPCHMCIRQKQSLKWSPTCQVSSFLIYSKNGGFQPDWLKFLHKFRQARTPRMAISRVMLRRFNNLYPRSRKLVIERPPQIVSHNALCDSPS